MTQLNQLETAAPTQCIYLIPIIILYHVSYSMFIAHNMALATDVVIIDLKRSVYIKCQFHN